MSARSTNSRHACRVQGIRGIALFASVLCAMAAPVAADETTASAVPASASSSSSPAAPSAPRPVPAAHRSLRLRTTVTMPAVSWSVGEASSATAAPEEAMRVTRTRMERMERAFAAEMREEAITSRRAALYATIPLQLPELLEDDYILKQQSRVAESVIGSAVEAAVYEGFFAGKHAQSSVSVRPILAVAEHGIKLDASPSWTYRIRSERTGFRVEVPLIPSTIRLSAYREMNGTNRTPLRFGAGLLIDPFDEEIRAGVSFQF